jgi:hypothetical protein
MQREPIGVKREPVKYVHKYQFENGLSLRYGS